MTSPRVTAPHVTGAPAEMVAALAAGLPALADARGTSRAVPPEQATVVVGMADPEADLAAVEDVLLASAAALQQALPEAGAAPVRLVVVTGDPSSGSIAARAVSAGLASLAGSLAVEWAGRAHLATVVVPPAPDPASVCDAVDFALRSPHGTVVSVGGST